jgi:hypothetical protein
MLDFFGSLWWNTQAFEFVRSLRAVFMPNFDIEAGGPLSGLWV